MATVILDFDSTLISCESLEEILKQKLLGDPEKIERMRAITARGMSGECSFMESLTQRLALAVPTRQDVIDFGNQAEQWLTPEMEAFVHDLSSNGVEIWIISGGIREALLPLGKKLGISPSHIHGVSLCWSADGLFEGIDQKDPFSHSKFEGAKELVHLWSFPKIAIGDGMTDFALYENRLVDYFIAFTQHARRQSLIDKCIWEASSVQQLRQFLICRGVINHESF